MSESEQLQREIGQSAIGNGSKVTSDCNVSANAWNVNFNNGNVNNNNNKTNTNRVRAVAPVQSRAAATSLVVYDIPFSQIIEAWIDCERNKRSSDSCTKFRWHAHKELAALWRQVRSRAYQPAASMCFIVTHPVTREVFAGAFRDRVIHHWEALRIVPLLDRFFVMVGDASMNCRKGYGALRAVRRMEKMLWDYTRCYTRQDCYILGGDFANYFMSIDKQLLWEMANDFILTNYEGEDKECLLYLCGTTLFHRPQEHCYKRSPDAAWAPLPDRKSLFHCKPERGMPIGNFPSQLWANFIGAVFTDWIMNVRGYKAFLIFVDDWRVLVGSYAEGKRLAKEVREYLDEQLHVTLHPDKLYLQHYTKGTKMVGAVVKPRRTYIANRTRGAFISKMIGYNRQAAELTHRERIAMLVKLRATINSYLGMMIHYNSYKVRRKIAEKYILPTWKEYLYFEDEFRRCVIRRQYDDTNNIRKKLRNRAFAARLIRPHYQD
jgi:hypothetical protein